MSWPSTGDIRTGSGMKVVAKTYEIVEVLKGRKCRLKWSNGKTTIAKCEVCGICKKHVYYQYFIGGVCFSCKGVKVIDQGGFECVRGGNTYRYRSEAYARLRQATPTWVDPAELGKFRQEARRLTKETGIPHHVDHIWPIIHEDFCGLNVPWNLRVIPAKKNMSKHNKPPLDFHTQNTYG